MMNIYFLRHAHAIDGHPDDSRPLSPRGRKQSKKLGKFLIKRDISFDRVYTSPLTRAMETSKILSKTMGLKKKQIVSTDYLKNETPSQDFQRWLLGVKGVEHILLVGHEPSLSEHVRRLLKIQSVECFTFPKAGLVCVEKITPRSYRLNFFVTPTLIN